MMKAESNVIEIEVNASKNLNLFFAPLSRRLRGRFDLNRVAEPRAKMKVNEWPEPIPGQRLSIDTASGVGQIIEPLQEQQHAGIKRRIERSGASVADPVETIEVAHVPTWLFWMRAAVLAGLAELVKGEFPTDLGGEPQRSFITQPRPTSEDRLVAAIEKQNELLGELVKTLKQR